MAVDKFLEIYDEQGNPVDYDIRANDVKFPDGESLPDKLAEIESDVEAAGQVNDIKVGSETYSPTNKTIDLTDAFAEKQDVINDLADIRAGASAGDTALQPGDDVPATDVTGLASVATSGSYNDLSNKPTIPTKTSDLENDEGYLAEAVQSVTVETNEDGTVDFVVDNDTYKVNLNHTHPNMAKLEMHTPATIPDEEEMESDTIYAEVEDGEVTVLYVGGVPFYGGGGGGPVTGPIIRRPADGSTIDIGDTVSGSLSATVNIKGKNLTQALTVELSGTGYSFGTTQPTGVTRVSTTELTVTAAAANALNGVDVAVECTGSDSDENIVGELGITSSENISVECTLYANYVAYETLSAVKFTRQQYVDMGFLFGANSRIEIDMQVDGNLPASMDTNTQTGAFISTAANGSPSQYVSVNFGASKQSDLVSNNQTLFFWIGKDTSLQPKITFADYSTVFDRSWLKINNVTKKAEFQSLETSIVGMTIDSGGNLLFGSNSTGARLFVVYDIILYEFKHYESGTLTHDYVPKKRNGVVGLYDTVTGNFTSSSTNVSLEAII